MAVRWWLNLVDGPRAGEKVRLETGKDVVVGRTKQGIDLLDPRVSARHAELSWREDRFWIRDLESATGTLVDGIAIGTEAVPISDGTRLLIGETVIEVAEERRLLPQWVYWVALVVLALTAYPFFLFVSDLSLWDQLHPSIEAPEPVQGHRGFLGLSGDPYRVELDRCFMRETGASSGDVSIRRVTDWDGDGVSEIWIEGATWERVYTFDPGGQWRLLGEMPKGCLNSDGAGFRPMTCGDPTYVNERYVFRPGVPFSPGEERCAVGSNKGHYQLERLRGAYVWIRDPSDLGGPPRPWHLQVQGANVPIASWLGERGIDRPVHFIVCEEFFPDMSAQVLTEDGQITQLQPGCGESIQLRGNMVRERFGTQLPSAVAFTATGREHLLEQMNVFLGGSERRHFQNPSQQAWHDAISVVPERVTSDFVVFRHDSVRGFNAVASESPRLRLKPFERLGGLRVPGLRRATDWTWADPEPIVVSPCGEYVRIETSGWRCGPPCFASRPFMTVTQVNGQQQFQIQYTPGMHRVGNEDIEISVDLRGAGLGMVPQVVYASVAVRDMETCPASGQVEDNPAIPRR